MNTPQLHIPRCSLPRHGSTRSSLASAFVSALLASLGALLFVPRTHGAIPAAALADPRYELGYLVVTYYSGVDPTGVADSTAGINQAIKDAQVNSNANRLAVFFPPGTYKISNTLQCFNWAVWDPALGRAKNPPNRSPALVGSSLGGARPVIKLAAGASGFGNASVAKPMLAFREIEAINSSGTAEVTVSNAFLPPANFEFKGPNLFNYNLRNLDFDCNGQAGAVGVSMDGAQQCSIQNVRVAATGAFAGFVDLPGPGGVANIEVEGGRYGVVMGNVSGVPTPSSYSWGSVVTNVAGARLQNQTIAAIVAQNFSGPVQFVGFYIKPAAGGKAVLVSTATSPTSEGTFALLDGAIDMANNTSAYAIDNTPGKSAVLRNVYVTNSGNLIKSAALTTTGTGTWKRIVDYAYTDQAAPSAGDPPYESGDNVFETFSLLPHPTTGTLVASRTPAEPIKVIQNSVAAPDTNGLITRHLWTELPTFEDGATGGAVVGVYANPNAYGATPDGGAADRQAFQAAIDAASTAGHGRVVIPRGNYELDGTLTLRANTKLFGAGIWTSRISVHSSWQPTSGTAVMIQTDDNANATTFLGFLTLVARRSGGGIVSSKHVYDRFSHVLWRAGRNSASIHWYPDHEWLSNMSSHPRTSFKFTGNGGGRHHAFASDGRNTGGTGYRVLVFDGTSEPTWFYNANVEASKGGGPELAQTNIEMNDASNIRLIGLKREGTPVPTAIMTNVHNVALFGHEVYGNTNATAQIQVLGASDGVYLGWSGARVADSSVGGLLFREAITGKAAFTFAWPQTISVYKRGTLDDTIMIIGGGGSAPAAPSNAMATPVSSSQINVSWTDNANNETGFEIDRATNSTFTAGLATNTVGANTQSFNSTGLSASTTYYYRVRAVNSLGNSAYSNTANATTQAGGGGSNLLANPGFETTASWTNYPTSSSTQDGTNAYAGTYRLKITGSGYPEVYQQVAVTPGSVYEASVWNTNWSSGGTARGQMRLNWYQSGTPIGTAVTITSTAESPWMQLQSGSITAPAGATHLRMTLKRSASVAGNYFFDEASIVSAGDTSLKTWLKFDETSGTSAADASGNGNNGALINGPTWISGQLNGGVNLDGTNDHVSLPSGQANFSSGMTVAVWAYPETVKDAARFFDFGNGQASNNITLARAGTTNTLRFRVYNGSTAGAAVDATSAIVLNTWQRFAVTIDGSGNVKLYKNGAQIATGTTSVPVNITRSSNYIGRSNWTNDAYYDGKLDDFRVYNRVLSATEIAALP